MSDARNATLTDLADLLKDQHARKIDMVAPATGIRSVEGNLVIEGTEPVIDLSGVSMGDGVYRPTDICDEGISEKFGIPRQYLRRLRDSRIDLYDANVNGWLHGDADEIVAGGMASPDKRSFLVRGFKPEEPGGEGVARAFLSDRYRMVDNLDVLMASLEGIEQAGVNVNIEGCDLTDRRMYVRIVAPEVQARAETLLKNYRNPFGDDYERWRQVADREGMGYGGTDPILFAGFVISNSEVGGGAFSITPRVVAQPCKNGLTMKVDMMRDVHLGGRLDAGLIDWSDETQRISVDLVRSKTTDAVRTFLSPEYLTRTIEALEQKAEEPVATVEAVKTLTAPLRFSAEQVDGILNRFVQGGQMTRGGVVNAITAHAQEVEDADDAHKMETQAAGLLV